MAVPRRITLWQLLAVLAILLTILCSVQSSSVGLRRVNKSTHSDTSSTLQWVAGPVRSATKRTMLTTKASGTTSVTLRQRVDQAVQKVRARSREIQMEQEQKRVDRKLRRDQKKLEREQPTVMTPLNPHNLQMPECATGQVYNGRRCVSMGKLTKH